jgi:NAD(P)H dehydrogenase (quinone)
MRRRPVVRQSPPQEALIAMRVLVIYAHPLADSFAAALHQAVVAALRRSGHEVDVCDLYAEGFDPVLTAAERRAYNTPSPDLAAVAGHVARLRAAEALVLCFPTWWYGMPAILKGYFDRVWAPGVALRLPEGGGAILPGLTNITKFWVVTSYGAPWWLIRLALRDPVRAVLLGGLARLCGRRVETRFLALYNIDAATHARCARFLARVERACGRF